MEHTNSKRRNFLLAFGLGGLGAAAALIAGNKPESDAQQAPAAEVTPAHKGYRLSEHVETYYRKARI